ncbi:nucleoside deaminase [Spongisporangium articulatum]|uniref:Nucleoside deaminase n=1 Tax=Spongisporangium articulatum TaxID=3362603 RepID=A0ABW8AGE7_9ACTN
MSDEDRRHLLRCVELAEEALEAGDEPFGSVLVDADGAVLAEARNRVNTLADETEHPEFTLARWSNRLQPDVRAAATVYTSGEHCPMCSAAHAWVGLGRIVYASSSEQLTGWLAELGVQGGRVRPLPVQDVAPHVPVDGPAPEFADRMRSLHARLHGA